MTPEAFELNLKMAASNPDSYSIWNHRREMLNAMFATKYDGRCRSQRLPVL